MNVISRSGSFSGIRLYVGCNASFGVKNESSTVPWHAGYVKRLPAQYEHCKEKRQKKRAERRHGQEAHAQP